MELMQNIAAMYITIELLVIIKELAINVKEIYQVNTLVVILI